MALHRVFRLSIVLAMLAASLWFGRLSAHAEIARAPGLQRASLDFVQNAGQFAPGVRFRVQTAAGTLWLAEDGLWISVVHPAGAGAAGGVHLKLSFAGSNPHPRLEPFGRLQAHTSYFQGADPARWHADVPVWAGVRYVGLYPGVDLELAGAGGEWQQRLRLEAGADPRALDAVRLHVEGADGLAIDGGRLSMATAAGEVSWPLFESEYALAAARVEDRDVARPFTSQGAPLLLQPQAAAGPAGAPDSGQLLYATFLGGSGNDAGWAMAQDSSGAIYLSGSTDSPDFPTTPGAYQASPHGVDAFVAKLDAGGTALLYATFLGGGGEDAGRAIAVDASGSAYLTGYTASPDFPTTPGALQSAFGGVEDIFVTRLNADGSALVYSTLVGRGGMEEGRDILVGPGDVAVVAGLTKSAGFPVTAGAFQRVYGGRTDGVVFSLNAAGSALVFSTYLGGTDYDEARAVQQDSLGTLYVTGRTRSPSFPTTAGAFQRAYAGNSDAFVTRLNALGSGLIYSTLLGGSDYDYGRGLALDAAGSAYVTGLTFSSNFPSTPGALQTVYGGNQDAFVTRLDASGSALVYSTYLGRAGGEAGRGVIVDAGGAAYLSGWTTSRNFPTTPGAYQRVKSGAGDCYVARLNASGSALDYSTYLGGSGDDGPYGGVLLDAAGAIVVSGYTVSPDLPATPGALQPIYGGGANDVFFAKLLPPLGFAGAQRSSTARPPRSTPLGRAHIYGILGQVHRIAR